MDNTTTVSKTESVGSPKKETLFEAISELTKLSKNLNDILFLNIPSEEQSDKGVTPDARSKILRAKDEILATNKRLGKAIACLRVIDG